MEMDQTQVTASGSGSFMGLSRTGALAPVLVSIAAIAVGWWVYAAVDRSLHDRNADDLRALVDAEVAVLRCMNDAHPDALTPADVVLQSAHAPAGHVGDTGEVLVIDADARLLTSSRFAAALADLGLPTEPRMLTLRDPGVDLTRGRLAESARSSMPLTKAAGYATRGEAGEDIGGYRSYRGVDVVGAWRWLDDLQLGVIAEMEVAEANAPARVLLRAYLILVGLAVIAAFGGVYVSRRNAALLSKVREAESKARTLGQYTLVRKIGEGGMGEVYLARHAMLRRLTAIKLLRADRTREGAVARFEREVQQTSRLTHPNTVQIYDFGRTPGGTFYYAMECLVGIPLDRFVREVGPLPEGRVIYILQQVCGSLNEAHGLSLVHRDIKPENIFLCRTGGAFDVVKVLDFGLVMDRRSQETMKLSGAGTILGTPLYMSPEAFLSPEKVDARSDLYALGAVGYFLLTGKPPFEGESIVELFNKQTKVKPVLPSERIDREVFPDLEQVVMACLEKDPERRPKSANAFSRELEWCRSFGDWNRDKARYWWREHGPALNDKYGLDSDAWLDPSGATGTVEIRLDGR